MAKGLKLKVRKFLGLNPTFVEVTEEKLVWGDGGEFFGPSILNRVNIHTNFKSILSEALILKYYLAIN